MPASKAQQKAHAKYNKKAYDRLEMKVHKGEKEKIVAYAMEHDGSLNKFLNRAVKNQMENDKNA